MALGSLTPVTKPTTGTFESILVDFSAAGGAKPRRYRVDLTGADLGGIFLTSAIYSIWPAEQRGPTAFFMGDSLFGGSGMSTSSIAQIPEYIGSLFGWDNVWNLGIGGTGYVAKNAPSSFDNSSLPQVQYLAPSASAPTTTTPGSAMPTPEIVVMAYGHNDTMNSTTYTAATNTFTAARSQWPNAFIIAMGPLGNGFNGTSYNAGETSIFSAVSSLVDGTLSMWQGTGRPWMYGSGKVGSTTGTSNGDIYVGTDGVHWTDAGIAFMGDHIAPELKRILTQ
ncbi:SGNH/GDSL hydrolase family protein [Frankia casuarinae]|uniref:SGNH/GDSL hydrolase family protein n=2 Tax=Frankia TaxID=1854 RepID=UPI0036F3B62E